MARSRNIKPSIMDNEELAELEPIYRLLFIYLWMLADREGRLEDRPKRIAAQALPYDRSADVDAMLNALQSGKFIRRYKVGAFALIQIAAFVKHQAPHGTEKDSALPDENGMLTVYPRGKNGYASGDSQLVNSELTVKPPCVNALIPDSGFLIPDSLIPDCGGVRDTPAHTQLKTELRESIKALRPDLDPEAVFQGYRQHYPVEKRTRAKLDKWVIGEKSHGTQPLTADSDSRASIETLGLSRGFGKWDELQEPWTTYRKRVKDHTNA